MAESFPWWKKHPFTRWRQVKNGLEKTGISLSKFTISINRESLQQGNIQKQGRPSLTFPENIFVRYTERDIDLDI